MKCTPFSRHNKNYCVKILNGGMCFMAKKVKNLISNSTEERELITNVSWLSVWKHCTKSKFCANKYRDKI